MALISKELLFCGESLITKIYKVPMHTYTLNIELGKEYDGP